MSSSPKSSCKSRPTHLPLRQTEPVKDSFFSNSDQNLDCNSLTNSIESSVSCGHLLEIRSKLGPDPFFHFKGRLKIQSLGRASIRLDPPDNVPQCGACGLTQPRLYICVACASIFCHLHAPSHVADEGDSSSHSIAIDIDRAELFCCICRDQVYDRDFDAAVVFTQSAVSTIGPVPDPSPENTRKRRRVEYRPWTPDLEEQALIGEKSSPLMCQPGLFSELDSELPRGLRGLSNLGNTCFMNSVLQALLHTPPLRNFFLSDKHNRYFCKQKNDVNTKSNGIDCHSNKNVARICLACDLDATFSAVFSGDRMPYSPAKFLYSWWQHASNLASYEQQDAHEFFISVLDGIHEKVKDELKPQRHGNGDCCIAHRIFSGILRSDVMCSVCGFTSTTYDPCVDISLDLEPNLGGSKLTSAESVRQCIYPLYSMNSGERSEVSTLIGCLDRFTRPERLGSDQKFFCQQCQVRQESLKQMSIRKLPLVSCFHIKRFEHSHIKKMSRKIDQYLQFPFSLDMAPYLSSSILRSRFGNRYFPSHDNDDDDDFHESGDGMNEPSSEFELFAVITHTGKLNAGHYVTYLRLSNRWFKCDDAWITQVNDNIVRSAQGYMMFYVQKMLYYKASEKHS